MKTLLRFFHTSRPLVVLGIVCFAGTPIGHAAGFPSFEKIQELGKTVGDVGRTMKGATGLSLEEELAIGDAVSLEIVGRFGGVWRDEPAMWRVNLVGRTLSRFAVRQDLTWRFAVLDSKSINAFSAPGGRVFITRGLYEIIRSDDELAGVLAHEIAHIDRRHALKIIARGEFLGGVTALVADRDSDFSKYDEAVSMVTDNLIDKGYDSNSEFDADKEGRDLAKITGFAPGGLRAVIERLDEMEKDKSRVVFSTHPPADKRLRKLPKDPPPPETTSAPSS